MASPTQRANRPLPGPEDHCKYHNHYYAELEDKNGVSLSRSGMALFYKSLAHAVDEIGISRNKAGAPHVRRDLTAMVG